MSSDLMPSTAADETLLERRRAEYPLGAALTWDLLEDHARIDVLHGLREAEPVTWCDAVGGWLVTSRAIAQEVYRSPDRFTVHAEANLVRAVLGEMMLAVDGEQHDRHRAPFSPTFKLRAVHERFADAIRRHTARLLDELEPCGGGELGADFAAPFAIAMAAEVLGIPVDQLDRLRETYEVFAAAMTAYDDAAKVERALEARAELSERLSAQLAAARRSGRSTLLADVAEEALSDEEVIADARVIMFGAIETVEGMILNTIWALLTHDAACREVRADPELLSGAIDEALRWLPPVGFVERWACEDTTLGGASIAAGDFVVPVIIAANRDPAHFADPDRFDIHRPNARQSVAFSQGIHHCLGVNLARLEGRLAIGELLRRWPQLHVDPQRPSTPAGFASRRLRDLHVRWN